MGAQKVPIIDVEGVKIIQSNSVEPVLINAPELKISEVIHSMDTSGKKEMAKLLQIITEGIQAGDSNFTAICKVHNVIIDTQDLQFNVRRPQKP